MSKIIEHDHLTADELGLDNGSGARIYADVFDDGTARVTLVDYTRAHTSRHPELADGDRSGWLTDEARAILTRLATERFGVAGIDDDTGDEPNITFEWDFPHAAGNATAAQLGTAAWPNVAAALNETDPGTFGARYIYADVARELEAGR